MLSISGKKEQHLAMFFCFSIPVLNQRAWFSGKPVPQFKKKKKKEKKGKKQKQKQTKKKTNLLVVSYRKERKTPTFSTDTTYCSVKEFSLPKKRKKKKKNNKKNA